MSMEHASEEELPHFDLDYFRQRIIEERLRYPAVIYSPAYVIPCGLTDGAGI